MSRHFWIVLSVSVPVTVLGTLAAVEYWRVHYLPHTPAGIQAANMDLAEKHLPVIQKTLRADPRFNHVRLGVYTGLDGALLAGGFVTSEDDLTALKRAVESTEPPRPVEWQVQVLADR